MFRQGGNDFSQLCIVLPNRRAGVFLRNAIARKRSTAIWAPTIISIEDFVFGLSSFVKADKTTLLFAFYEVYRKYAQDPQTIELFAGWAPIFLSDINELDLNLIDAEDLFSQLYAIERIKKWNPQKLEPTEFQKKHLDFVKQFFPFYQQLRESLQRKGLAYQGMAFREVADAIDSVIQQAEWKQVWFAGFNALTDSEERIFSAWLQSGRARLFWDMDAFYSDDAVHEAGHYVRKYAGKSKDLQLSTEYSWKAHRLATHEKEIHLIAAQRNMTQASIAATVLDQRMSNGETTLTNTAVVLNDEQLLVPLLSALPAELDGVNITMGYGLRQSQSAVFVEHIFTLYSRYADYGGRFYHEHVHALEKDPFFQLVQNQKAAAVPSNQVFFAAEQLQHTQLHQLIYDSSWSNVTGFLTRLKQVLKVVAEQLEETSIEREFLFLLDKLAQRLIDLTAEFSSIDSVKTLHTFWRQLLRTQQLDFVGEPLTGLQVMGMLETRNLDFEEVIMLGVNEGNLPSSSHSPSYLTFDIRKAYGLPCQNERDAVTAYHFYRLLQRAKRVYLVYDQDTDSMGGGEVSRYVKQLLSERGDNITIKEWSVEQEIPESVVTPSISVAKGQEEMLKLTQLAQSGFSPSALNTFRTCPLKYYFRYMAGVKEPDEFQEDMDAAKLGTAIHDTLEELYTPFVGRALVASELQESKTVVEQVLLNRFKEQLKTQEDLSGPDLLTFEVAKTYVNRVIDHDLNLMDSGEVLSILKLEEELRRTLEFSLESGATATVLLKGMADRIDRLSDGTVRIIDYKTGAFGNKRLKINKVEDFNDTQSDIAFQLLLYRYMAATELVGQTTEPIGFFLRSNEIAKQISVFESKLEVKDGALTDYTEELLLQTLQDLFDPRQTFSQTEDVKRCEFCEFSGVCQR